MNKINDGGSVFPETHKQIAIQEQFLNANPEIRDRLSIFNRQYSGMSLRDWYAGMALKGAISFGGMNPGFDKFTAERSFQIADAMIAERNKNAASKD